MTKNMESQHYLKNYTKQNIKEWESDFEAAAKRPLRVRFKYSFIKTYKPVMDDSDFRAFSTMAEYRDWCEKNLPKWLGYAREV